MTNENTFKNLTAERLARKLYEFSVDFYSERLSGLCNVECADVNSSGDEKCINCIAKWLSQETNKFLK